MRLFELNLMGSKKIDITKLQDIIDKSDKPVYILIAGSVGSGKNFIIGKHLPTIDVVDPDAFTVELGNGEYDKKNVSKSMSLIRKEISERFKNKQTFLQQGTSANLQSTINKLKVAKQNGYITVLFYVDTPIEQAFEQVKKRVSLGGHGSSIDTSKVENTSKGAKLTFRALSGEDNNWMTPDDLSRIEIAVEKTEKTLEKARKNLDYYIRIDNTIKNN